MSRWTLGQSGIFSVGNLLLIIARSVSCSQSILEVIHPVLSLLACSNVPCRMVFDREVCLVTWLHQVSPIRRVSCCPAWVVNNWTRLFIALQYLVVVQKIVNCCHMFAGEDFSFDIGIVENTKHITELTKKELFV